MTHISYTMAEAMEALRIGRTRIYQDVAAGRLRTYCVGRRRYVSADAIRDYIRDREAEQTQAVTA